MKGKHFCLVVVPSVFIPGISNSVASRVGDLIPRTSKVPAQNMLNAKKELTCGCKEFN